jgi:hypothetical protein
MDTAHSIMFVVLGMQSLILVYAIVGIVKVATIASAAEESVKEIARIAKEIVEISSRTEKMTQSILQKVYDVSSPQA